MISERNMKKNRTAVITGSSSGIGFETSLLLARNGFHTYATMRNLDKSSKILHHANKSELPLHVIQLDVTDDKSVKEAIRKIVNEQDGIDVLVNNAGYGLVGPLEELSIEEFNEQFETNVFGAIRVIQQVLPSIRKQRCGTIINDSSINSRIYIPLTCAYVSSKFALEGLSESIAYELEQFGIKIMLIESGLIKTNFGNNLKIGKAVYDNPNSPYAEITRRRISGFKGRIENGSSPIEVAKAILKAITLENPPVLRYLVGDDAFKLMEEKILLTNNFES